MPSITTWARLETPTLSDDVEAGLAARLYDPLWLLARQWQVGEFQGEDGGSPIVARWRGTVSPLTRYHLGPIPPNTELTAARLDHDGPPLEAFVERQEVRQPSSDTPGRDGVRLGVETGRHFLRMLTLQHTSRDYADAFIRTYGLLPLNGEVVDKATSGFVGLMAGRALDGRRLRAALRSHDVPALDGDAVDPVDTAEVREVCRAWAKWSAELFSQPTGEDQAWQPDRMEYAFSVAARLGADPFDERTLTAAQYSEGTLDWHSFDVNGEVNVGTTPEEAGQVVTRTVVPAPVSLRGMPAPRFWEFEDALLDLGALQPGATEITKLLMIETISGYGNDWFVIPVDLPVGSLVTARSLVVTDTFGARTLLRPNGDHTLGTSTPWSMFQLAMPVEGGVEGVALTNLFFLPPTLVQSQEGTVLEEVLLLRDELANMAWAVERTLESPMERALDAAVVGPDVGDEELVEVSEPTYRLASSVPPHWIPLLPIRSGDSEQVRLARAALLDLSGQRKIVRSQARLLGENPTAPLLIPEEEVPREGAVVRRGYQGARWHDGRLVVWSTHRKSAGRGEGFSGLRFDTLQE
jgi:hypothetical protein